MKDVLLMAIGGFGMYATIDLLFWRHKDAADWAVLVVSAFVAVGAAGRLIWENT